MLHLILSWLREAVKNAVLAGVQDAVAELDKNAPADQAKAIESLRERFPEADKSRKKLAS